MYMTIMTHIADSDSIEVFETINCEDSLTIRFDDDVTIFIEKDRAQELIEKIQKQLGDK